MMMTNKHIESLPQKWLLVRFSSLGDVVLATGPMHYLHKKYGWTFTVLTRPAFAPIFENNPFVEEVITPGKSQLKLPGSIVFFGKTAAAYQGCGLLDLHISLRSRLLSLFWRGPILRYPKYTMERRDFLRERCPEHSALLRATSVTQRYTLAVEAVAPRRAELLPEIYLTATEKEAAAVRLEGISKAQTGTRLVALHPFATHARKTWPREYWLELTRRLNALNIGWFVVGQGAPLFPGDARDFSNRTSLRELAALLSESALLVTGDSGPMHLASAAGTSVLGLFGPTTAEWGFYPAGPRDRVMELPLACRPCSLHGAQRGKGDLCDGRCLSGISPQDVAAAVLAQLEAADV